MNVETLPEHWKSVQLEEIASLRRENIKPEGNRNLNYVGLEHIDSGESQLKRWGDASEVKSAKSRFYPDDVLYGKLRPYLDKAALAEMEGICSTDILVVTANLNTIPGFLTYILHCHSLIGHAVATSTGVNHPRTSWNSLGKYTFSLPPLPEQRAIARVLQTIQEAKAARQREIELERERKAALMDYLFSHGTKGEPRKQTEIGEIPESWEVVKLADLCVKAPTKGATPTTYGYKWVDDGVLFLRSECILSNQLSLQGAMHISHEAHDSMKRSQVFPGDILIRITGQVGYSCLFPAKYECANINQHISIVRLKDNSPILPRFLVYFLNSSKMLEYCFGITRGVTHPHLNLAQVKSTPVFFPDLESQLTISHVLDSIDTKIAALEQEAARLDELFHAMLDELMTGKRSAVPLIHTEISN